MDLIDLEIKRTEHRSGQCWGALVQPGAGLGWQVQLRTRPLLSGELLTVTCPKATLPPHYGVRWHAPQSHCCRPPVPSARASEEGISPAMVAQKALEASQGQVGPGGGGHSQGTRWLLHVKGRLGTRNAGVKDGQRLRGPLCDMSAT